jgi:hypothetical protein
MILKTHEFWECWIMILMDQVRDIISYFALCILIPSISTSFFNFIKLSWIFKPIQFFKIKSIFFKKITSPSINHKIECDVWDYTRNS